MSAVDNATRLPRTREPMRDFASRYAAALLLVALTVFFSLKLPATFGQFDTLRTLVATQAILAILALGLLFPLIVGEFDFSVAATAGLASLVAAWLNGPEGAPLVIALIAAIAAGAGIGLVNGLLVTKARITSLISTLGVSVILSGLAIWISGGQVISANISQSVTKLGRTQILGQIPVTAVYLAVVAAVVWLIIDALPFGRYLRVVGASERSAYLLGIPVQRMKLAGFLIAGTIGGLAGAIMFAKQGSADPSDGPQLLLPAYAAVFLGATTIRPGRFNVAGTLVAVFLLAVGVTGLQLWGAPVYVEPIFDGSALIVAVGLSVRVARRTSAV